MSLASALPFFAYLVVITLNRFNFSDSRPGQSGVLKVSASVRRRIFSESE